MEQNQMTPLPKHLEEMREFSLHEEGMWYGIEELPSKHKECKFAVIERAAIDIMLKDLESMAKALEFYAPSNSYDYDKTQGVNYIWNDLGKQARETLKNYREKYK